MSLHFSREENKWPYVLMIGIILILGAAFFYFKKHITTEATILVKKGDIAERAEAVGSVNYYQLKLVA